jgi:hypothetical protein
MPDPEPQDDPSPSGKFRLFDEIEKQEVLVEEQTLAGSKVLTAVVTDPWRVWIGEFAAHVQLGPREVLKQALAIYAEQAGFTKRPPM